MGCDKISNDKNVNVVDGTWDIVDVIRRLLEWQQHQRQQQWLHQQQLRQ